jgi:putative ABC transport system permease protein
VINESLARSKGWSSPIGKSIRLDGVEHEVIGVVSDFTFFFLARPLPALFLASAEPGFNYMTVRFKRGLDEEVHQFVEASWKSVAPDTPLRVFFQRNVFDDQFDNYNRVVSAFSYLSALALLIACMGLFGLASQNLSRRMKEMSIRKIVGASVPRLALLLNRAFIVQITIAGAIATVVCLSGLTILLSVVTQTIPVNHMPFTPTPFVLSYLLVITTALLALMSQVRTMARTNPADILRVD